MSLLYTILMCIFITLFLLIRFDITCIIKQLLLLNVLKFMIYLILSSYLSCNKAVSSKCINQTFKVRVQSVLKLHGHSEQSHSATLSWNKLSNTTLNFPIRIWSISPSRRNFFLSWINAQGFHVETRIY